jgi:hypothetical protein
MPAAAAAVAAAILLPRLTSNPPPADSAQRTRRVTDTEGRSRLAIVSPTDGVIARAPLMFTWRSATADVYRIVLETDNGGPVWTADTPDTTIALPDSVSLNPGRAYFWRVDAIGNGIAATTGAHPANENVGRRTSKAQVGAARLLSASLIIHTACGRARSDVRTRGAAPAIPCSRWASRSSCTSVTTAPG